jgi:glucosylglycerol-phosphate synthase
MLLATDLDGTFLAGTDEDRQRLYQLINRHPQIQLAFVTGRGLESVRPLLSDPILPRPDYIICDVGATVVDGQTLQPIQPLQSDIDQTWPGESAIAMALADVPDIQRQEFPQERRCSYFCRESAVTDALRKRVEALGCDLLFSNGVYLDVLPRGVNKGNTLRQLVEQLGIPVSSVLTAGDTLNDLSMLDAGFKAVAVGESEPSLMEATRGMALVLQAEQPGCGGILEALSYFGFLGEAGIRSEASPTKPYGQSRLLMVYHRLPYEEVVEDGKTVRRRHRSPNGILPSLLSFFKGEHEGTWVAWSKHEGRGRFETHTDFEPESYPNLTVRRVPLSPADVETFYQRFSKEAFWPTLHTFWERARFREEDWQTYLQVNQKFAEATADEAAEGATVWIHDYNLWMVPAYLRARRPDLKIAFFHHTYFPSADVFNVVPWRREIIGSLLQCDYIGFHIPRQVENFVDAARGAFPFKTVARESCAPRFQTYGCAVGLGSMTSVIDVHGRSIQLGAHPVGVDVRRIEEALQEAKRKGRLDALRKPLQGVKMILSVERLDYTKGTLEKLVAFEKLLETYPELHHKITLVTVCVPAAGEMTVYDELQMQIEQAVGRINGRYSRVGWTPVQFFFRGMPFDEICAYYAMADVAWITPLRDGLNLVCKEYVAVQGLTQGRGVLVLSEFAGAAAELKGAILTNPHDTADLVSGLYLGLNMGRAEAESRLRQLFDDVRYHDIQRWADEFLGAVNAGPVDTTDRITYVDPITGMPSGHDLPTG